MKLGFYYHVTIYENNGNLYVPGYLGVFLDAIAARVDFLHIAMHEANNVERKEADYKLESKNVKWINLGYKTPAWHRTFFSKKILGEKLNSIGKIDAFIIRAPTPLSPYISRFLKSPKIFFIIVGDYTEGSSQRESTSIREVILKLYVKYIDRLFIKTIKSNHAIVNSPILYDKYINLAKSVNLIKTTTLSLRDIYEKTDTCLEEVINLLYTGRIDLAKGLNELIDALAILKLQKLNVILNIVGWEIGENKPIQNQLVKRAQKLGVEDFLIFHGKKSLGDELNQMYRNADIYVIPSYHEGFPRTIWEAMANSLPVIATKVGAIPHYLKDEHDALLIEPKSVESIAKAVTTLLQDSVIRQRLIMNGLSNAKENTLELQTERLLKIIKSTYE